MAVAQGSFTVGFLVGDYATWKDALADVAATLTGDLTFTQIATTNESLVPTLTTNVDIAGHTLKLTSNADHNWRLDGGNVAIFGAATTRLYIVGIQDLTGGGQVIIEKLNLKTTTTTHTSNMIYLAVNTGGTVKAFDIIIRDILIDCRSMTSGANVDMIEFNGSNAAAAATIQWFLTNILVCDFISASTSGYSFQLTNVSPETLYVENCVVDGSSTLDGRGFQFVGNGFKLVRNCAAINCVTCFNGMSLAQGYNNMSDDATAADAGWALGSGNLPSVTIADEFATLVKEPSDTYLLPLVTGHAKDGGSAPSIVGNTYGAVVAIARPHNTDQYSIGGKEYPSSPVITSQPTTQTIDEDATATFAVVATGATSYQWSRKEPGGSTWADVFGATSASYTTPVLGATSHQAQYRCTVTNAAGSVVSTEVYLLFTGYPLPGAGGAESPDRPTVTNVALSGMTLSMTVGGTADVFRVEVRRDGTVVAYAETLSAGALSVNLPLQSVEYVVAVVAGNYGSTHWSLPGYTGIWMAARTWPVASPSTSYDLTASDKVRIAGPMGAGLRFPFRFSSTTGAPEMSVGIDHVVDGMTQVLMTRVNERPIRREFGSPIAGILFAPDTEISADVSNAIQGALAEQEHRAEVLAVVFKRDRVNGKIFADIKFRVIRTHQSGNLVYPFEMNV